MGSILLCDICGKPTTEIAGKLYYALTLNRRSDHSNYTHQCDVGVCCQNKLLKGFNFKRRMTQAMYNRKRSELARKGIRNRTNGR